MPSNTPIIKKDNSEIKETGKKQWAKPAIEFISKGNINAGAGVGADGAPTPASSHS